MPTPKPKPWDRLLWGVRFTSRDREPMILGRAKEWEPSRGLLFKTRKQARRWCKARMIAWAGNPTLSSWRVVPVRVRERVEVAP